MSVETSVKIKNLPDGGVRLTYCHKPHEIPKKLMYPIIMFVCFFFGEPFYNHPQDISLRNAAIVFGIGLALCRLFYNKYARPCFTEVTARQGKEFEYFNTLGKSKILKIEDVAEFRNQRGSLGGWCLVAKLRAGGWDGMSENLSFEIVEKLANELNRYVVRDQAANQDRAISKQG